MTSKVSIITITYQAAELLRTTADSILNQTDRSFEYLIIDGKSTDDTLEIIDEIEKKCREIGVSFRWISESDKGIYDAMNKGLKLATGDYVWFMNAGDTIDSPDTLKNIWKTIQDENGQMTSTQPDFIYGETLIVDSAGAVMGKRRLKAPEVLTWKSFKMGMLVCHQSMLVKRETAPDFNLKYHYSGDFDWAIRCLRKSEYIHNTHTVIAHFMDGGVSKKKMKASLKERFQIMATNYGWLPTALRHLWFILRAAAFKLFHGWI